MIQNNSGPTSKRNQTTSHDISDVKPRKTPDIEEHYEDDFDEIDEDLPQDDLSDDRFHGAAKIGESHGITVSQSLGIDPSVDSLALEDYDHIEPVEKLN